MAALTLYIYYLEVSVALAQFFVAWLLWLPNLLYAKIMGMGKIKIWMKYTIRFYFEYVEILFSSQTQLRTNEYWLDNYNSLTLFGQLMKDVEFECDEAYDINQ